MKKIIFISIVYFLALSSVAQDITDVTAKKKRKMNQGLRANGSVVTALIIDNDTVPVVNYPVFRITSSRNFGDEDSKHRYYRLVRNVKKVYPYARLAGQKLKEYDAELAGIKSERKRKVFMKKVEKELKDEFGDELKNLTITQGRILIKLIDRETGDTSYELVKELRGTFSAFFWQTLARLFGNNLKSVYDANGEDRQIEDIIILIDAGVY